MIEIVDTTAKSAFLTSNAIYGGVLMVDQNTALAQIITIILG